MKHKLWINGKWQESNEVKKIFSPFDNAEVSEVHWATETQVHEAIEASVKAYDKFRYSHRYARSELLKAMASKIAERRKQFVDLMISEAGKPFTLAQAEVGRAIVTLTVASEEAKRFGGEVFPVDIEPTAAAYDPAVCYWVARGPVLGITPFNFPLNLVAHKVAPALASGNPIVIKAAPQTPGCANLLAEVFEQSLGVVSTSDKDSVPPSVFQVLHCSNELAEKAVMSPRVSTVSFTGSAKVGWHLQSKAIGKKLALELGGNAAVIIHHDADLKRAALRCAAGGFGYAGQSCISVQRIYVHTSVHEAFELALMEETKKLPFGDPNKKEVICGPVINEDASKRILGWIEDAKQSGARVIAGGVAQKNVIEPTILANVNPILNISCQEVFGPVVIIDTYEDYNQALDRVNGSTFGLQAGLFTKDLLLVRKAIRRLEVGAVMVNEIPTYRADQMPYGGVKASGLGREGIRYAMEEYSERKTIIYWNGNLN